MRLILLAGGLGTRVRELHPGVPKPLIPIAGEPFLKSLMRRWKARGVTGFTLSIGHMAQQIIDAIGDQFEGVPVFYCVENEPLGTGGALAKALNASSSIRYPCWVANADTWVDFDAAEMVAAHEARVADLTLLVAKTATSGDCGLLKVSAEEQVLGFERGSPQATNAVVHAGVSLFSEALANEVKRERRMPRSLEGDFFPQWISQGRKLFAFAAKETLVDMGTPEGLKAMEARLNSSRQEKAK